MLFTKLLGLVRRGIIPDYSEGEPGNPLALNNRGEGLFNQVLPERAELVRLGNSWGAQIPAASAWTALITIPTTLSNLALQNGESAGGKSYIIDRFWVKNVTTTAAANYVTPLAQVVPPGQATLVADNAAVLRYSLNGRSVNYAGKAQIVMASTATGCLLDKWMHFLSSPQPTSTSIAACTEVLCYGRYIVPPQGSFNINAQEAVSGGTLIAGVEWHEVQLPLPA